MQFRRRAVPFFVFLIVMVYLLQQASQLALTPLGEGMDSYYHMAYVIYLSNEGRLPLPGQNTVPQAIMALANNFPAPDQTLGEKYQHWAGLSRSEKEALKAEVVKPVGLDQYVIANYETQHPPLYYLLLSAVYPVLRNLQLDQQYFWLAMISILISALAFPAIYLTLRFYLSPEVSLLALLLIAWFPNLMPFLGRVTNDTLAFALAAWFLYFCIHPRHSFNQILIAGGLLGLGLFTKSYFLTLIPVYILTAPGFHKEHGRWAFSVKNLVAAAALSLCAVGALFAFNYLQTGYLLPLTEMQGTAQVSLVQKIMAVFRIDPVWFFVRGLFRLFIWSGYWSFVSPGILYYLPAVVVLAVLALKPRVDSRPQFQFYAIRQLWPHYLAIAFFIVGMLWHAALFQIRAELTAGQVATGNEGWYLNLLIGSVFIILIVLAAGKWKSANFNRLVNLSLVVTILLNLIARLAVWMFWTGHVRLMTFIRSVVWQDVITSLLQPVGWQDWLALPGIMQPALLTGGLTLVISLILTAWVTIQANHTLQGQQR